MKKFFGVIAVILTLVLSALMGCSTSKKVITFADSGWDSVKLNNAVAGFIAETAFGYDDWNEITGNSSVIQQGVKNGDIDVIMEEWTDNLADYDTDIEEGKMQEIGINFNDNTQGWYVPRYVIEGDSERGIEAVAPDLKTVQDLNKYKDIFQDDEEKDKGRIYGCIPGWEIDTVMYNKYLYNGLDKDFVYFRPGSEAALNTVYVTAYKKGEPIVGYYWEPTWLLGKYDFVLLEDNPYTNYEDFLAGKTVCPSVIVTIVASNTFTENNTEFCEFLSKYNNTSGQINESLAHMQDTGENHLETAKWFLKQHSELLFEWLDEEKAQLIIDALK